MIDYDTNVIETVWQYEEIKTPEKVGKLLSREEALKRIEEQDEPFWEKYEGYYSRGRIRNRKS